MENTINHRSFTGRIFLRQDLEPRNSTEVDPTLLDGLSPLEINQVYLQADGKAFKETQRWVSAGIIAVGGVLGSIIQPPEDPGDLAQNFVAPVIVQLLNYTSFHIGVNTVRRNTQNRLKVSAKAINEKDLSKIEENKAYIEEEIKEFKKTQRLVSAGIIVAGGIFATKFNPPEDYGDVITNFGLVAIITGLNHISFKKGFSLIRTRARSRLEQSGLL